MTLPFYCVIAAFVLNYLSKFPVAMAMAKEGKGYDNRNPREQQARLVGWGKRALAAHQNSFEVTPIFASCVLIGHLSQGNANVMNILSVSFVVSRVLYTIIYIADIHMVRSLVWGAGLFCSLGIALSSWL